MSEKKLAIHCGMCEVVSDDPALVVDHMVETGHCLHPRVRADIQTNPALRQEMVDALLRVQAGTAEAKPVTEEEMEELELDNPDVEVARKRLEERLEAKRRVN